MSNFYVYIYLDPRKPGNYSYANIFNSFLYEPFYIGKGIGYRYRQHLHKHHINKNTHKCNIIKKIKKETNREPIIIKLKENISNRKANKLEKLYIKNIGRYNLKTGPLTNMTDGGDGAENRVMLNKTRLKIIKNHADFSGDKNSFYGKFHTDKSKLKMSKSKYKNEKIKIDSKLTIPNVVEIKKLINEGEINKNIAKMFNVSPNLISGIRHNKKWKNINENGEYINGEN